MWPSGTPCAERSDLLPVPPREGFLLCSAPTFQLALDGDCIGDPLEFLMPHQTNGPASRRIAAKRARVVLPDAPVEGGAR
jgi:hypothetical protein